MYETILRPVLFLFDPERIHEFFVWFGEKLGQFPPSRAAVAFFCDYEHPSLRTRVAGINFKNPIGLGAGFDKDVRLTDIMPAVGFGFIEVGAVTHHPYRGNEGSHLARLPEDRALIVNYGLKNIGAEAILEKLDRLPFRIPVGVNIAKTNHADIKGPRSIEDYAATYRMLGPRFSYAALNVSCPNAQDGCMFQEPHLLDGLLAALAREKKPCPVFLKISSHLTETEADGIIAVVKKYPFVDGFIIGNLSKRRGDLALASPRAALEQIPDGGISGRPIREISTNLIRHFYRATRGRYAIIGLGGVMTAEDAYQKIRAGASLVEIVTGLIYGGPAVVRKINRGLTALLARDGFTTVAEAVGADARGENAARGGAGA